MGRKGRSVPQQQRDSNLMPSKQSKRKKLSPEAVDRSEKKIKHSDTESTTSENWLDIDLPSDSEFNNTIEMADTVIHQTQVQGDMSMHSDNTCAPVAAMSTPCMPNPSQMMFSQPMYGMPSPILQQTHQTLTINDTDAIRIATLIKDMIKEDISEMVKQQVALKTKDLRVEIDALKNENKLLKDDISDIRMHHDELEQYSRRTCVRIGNIRETEGESTDDIVLDVCKKSGADISIHDIDRSHRVGKLKSGKKREIIVKFVNYKARTRFIMSRKSLREKKYEIYLNEDHTRTRSDLAYQCRLLKKDKNSVVQSSWTFDGRQYIKNDKDVTIKINNVAELVPRGYSPKNDSPKNDSASSTT